MNSEFIQKFNQSVIPDKIWQAAEECEEILYSSSD